MIKDRLDLLDCSGVDSHEEAVFAGDSVALGDLRDSRGRFRDLGDLPRCRLDAGEGGDRIAQRCGVDQEPVSGDDADLFQSLDAFDTMSAEVPHADRRVARGCAYP